MYILNIYSKLFSKTFVGTKDECKKEGEKYKAVPNVKISIELIAD